MVAYWLGHPDYTGAFPASQVAQAAKDSVMALHWARVEGGYNVAYNGAHECVEDDGASSDGEGSGSDTPAARRDLVLQARQAAGNTTLGLGGILAASCPLPPSSSSSSTVITATPTTFATVTSTASSTASATATATVEPMYCYSFDPACYVSLSLMAVYLPVYPPYIDSFANLGFLFRDGAAQMSLAERAARSIRESRAAGVVLAARRMSSLRMRNARCLLEAMANVEGGWITRWFGFL